MIGMTVIGGFLGAGKTTLVNHILRNTKNRRIGVLVNDFGAINIDAELIEGLETDAIRLANGCICCGMGDDLSRALIRMLEVESRPEHLLIEASGVAEPWRIAELAAAAPEFASARILTMADATAIREQLRDRYVGDLAASQIGCADILILNKLDLLDEEAGRQVRALLAASWPDLPVITADHARVDVAALGLGAGAKARLHAARVAGSDAAEMFRAFRFTANRPFDRGRLEATMDRLPDWVLRLKGIVYLEAESRGHIIQASAGRWSLTQRHGLAAEGESRIVAIGLHAGYDEKLLTRLFLAALAARLWPPSGLTDSVDESLL